MVAVDGTCPRHTVVPGQHYFGRDVSNRARDGGNGDLAQVGHRGISREDQDGAESLGIDTHY